MIVDFAIFEMSTLSFLLGDARYPVQIRPIIKRCDRFANDPVLLLSPYRVTSRVSPDVFAIFLDAINGEEIVIRNENISELTALSDEFGFGKLSTKLTAFAALCSDNAGSAEVVAQLSHFEEILQEHSRSIAALDIGQSSLFSVLSDIQASLAQLNSDLQSLRNQLGAVEAAHQDAYGRLRGHFAVLHATVQELPINRLDAEIRAVQSSMIAFRLQLSALGTAVENLPIERLERGLAEATIRSNQLSQEMRELQCKMRQPNGAATLFSIFVRLTGRMMALQVKSTDTITDVKRMLADETGIPEGFQRLSFQSRLLRDGETLSQIHITKDSTLDLHV